MIKLCLSAQGIKAPKWLLNIITMIGGWYNTDNSSYGTTITNKKISDLESMGQLSIYSKHTSSIPTATQIVNHSVFYSVMQTLTAQHSKHTLK